MSNVIMNEAILASQLTMTKEAVLQSINSLQKFADRGNAAAEQKIARLREKYKHLLED